MEDSGYTNIFIVWYKYEPCSQLLRSFKTFDSAQKYIEYMHNEDVYYTMEPVLDEWENPTTESTNP